MVNKVMRLGALLLSCVVGLSAVSCSAADAQAQSASPASDKIQNEQHWIVYCIGNDIAGMLAFAEQKNHDHKLDLKSVVCKTSEVDASTFNYELTFDGADKQEGQTFQLTKYIWSPANYAPWAARLLTRFHLKGNSAQDADARSAKLLKDLSGGTSGLTQGGASASSNPLRDYISDVLIPQNQKVSSDLTENPLDPELHEEAALLNATLALQECAQFFSDVRPQLNRVVAHLAVAKALRGDGDYSDSGKLAEVILSGLGGREVEALELLKPLNTSTASDAMKSWLRAIRVRLIGDYRIAEASTGSRIERLEYARALAQQLNADALTKYLEKLDVQPTIECIRFAFIGDRSVQDGHMYAEPAIVAEQAVFLRDYVLTHDDAKLQSADDATSQLNLEPTGCLVHTPHWQLEAISWPNLASFHSRHLLNSIFQKYAFEVFLYGVKEQAQQTFADARTKFSQMKMFPVCQWSMTKKKPDWITPEQQAINEKAKPVLASMIAQHPQWFTFELWKIVSELPSPPSAIPAPASVWFKPRYPMGTAFDFQRRVDLQTVTLEELETLRLLAPDNPGLALDYAKAKYKKPTGDQLAQAFGDAAEFDLHAMRDIATADFNDASKYPMRIEKMATLQPSMYFELGRIFEDHDPKKALAAYEKGMQLGADDVLKSNNCDWLVNYYYDHDQKDKALKLALYAGDVYSWRGLATLGYLYERMNKLTDAETQFRNIDERYDDQTAFAFYVRHQDVPEYKKKMEEIAKSFPRGFVKWTADDEKSPPAYGGKIFNASDFAKKYGFENDFIVVACDGYRVGSIADLTRNRNINPRTKEVVEVIWDGKAYHTVKASPPDKRFGFDLHEWTADNK